MILCIVSLNTSSIMANRHWWTLPAWSSPHWKMFPLSWCGFSRWWLFFFFCCTANWFWSGCCLDSEGSYGGIIVNQQMNKRGFFQVFYHLSYLIYHCLPSLERKMLYPWCQAVCLSQSIRRSLPFMLFHTGMKSIQMESPNTFVPLLPSSNSFSFP